MSREIKDTNEYANIIISDVFEDIAGEETTVYTNERIERLYYFHDGAVVKYEWKGFPTGNAAESFNHRFTLVTPPSPNRHKFETGVIKTINFAGSLR
jgi:hypothetical protein